MTGDEAPRDLIAEYLDRLRRGLRVRAGEAELILAEAEDHLRESEAAGLAAGMTGREAQEAAISGFGPVRAVTRAHLARAAGGPAVAVMAAWKLVSLLLLAAGTSGMAIVVFTGLAGRVTDPGQILMAGPGPYQVTFDRLTFNPVSGVWAQTTGWVDQDPHFISGGTVTWLNQPFPGWHAAVLMVIAGAVMLAGYGLARWRFPRAALAGLFPAVAVSVFGAITLALGAFELRAQSGLSGHVLPVFAICLAVTLGYAVRLGQVLFRQR
jgi:ABC-type glycerol-3-phosphate transport system permease component